MPGLGVGVGPWRRRVRPQPALPPWTMDALGASLQAYAVASDSVGSPVDSVPSRGLGIGLTSTLTARPAIAGGIWTFDGVNDNLRNPGVQFTFNTPAPVSVDLPDGQGRGTDQGFTGTGHCIAADGVNRWVGNDGRFKGGSVYDGSLVKVSGANRNVKLAEYTMTSMGFATDTSTQGVVVIPASVTGTVDELCWVRTTAGGAVVHRCNEATGAYIGTAFGGAGLLNGNALGYDGHRDAFIFGDDSNFYWHARTAANLSSPILTMQHGGADQCFYDAARKWLWWTGGPNGAPGFIKARNINNAPNSDHLLLTMTGADSIEGIVVADGKIELINDAGFHVGAGAKNATLLYDIPSGLPKGEQSYLTDTRVQFFGVARVPVLPGSATCIVAIGTGDPVVGTATGSTGFYASSTAGRLTAFQNASSASWNGLTPSSEFLYFLDINMAADTAQLWINGVDQGVVAFSLAQPTNTIARSRLSVGYGPTNTRPFAGEMAAVGMTMGTSATTERQRIEGRIAWDTSRTALLPGGHPYKGGQP